MLSDQEWETWPFEDEASGFEKFTDESAEPPDQTNATKQTNETLQKLQLLCRVCGSSGLINIKSAISRSTMKVKQSGDLTKWNVSIAQVIQDISGEPVRTSSVVEFHNVDDTFPFQVSTSDNLPQFICQHCLGQVNFIYSSFFIFRLSCYFRYLEHAFAMRLQMRAYSATVRFYIDLAENEPRQAAEADFNQSAKTTKAEISEFEDEINDESHFHSHFEGAAISIAPSTSKQFSQRVIEHKCQSCNKRVMSITSLNKHLEHCEVTHVIALQIFL